jgi:monovalent cation:H+ antiporter, CPA1 family
LALSLPFTLPGRSQVVALVFSTVLISLVGQGLSLPILVKRLRLTTPSPTKRRLETLQLTIIAAKAAQQELTALLQAGSLPKNVYEELFAAYQAQVATADRDLRELYNQRSLSATADLEDYSSLDRLRRRLYTAEKGAINDALRKGLLSEEVSQAYLRDLNERLLSLKDD